MNPGLPLLNAADAKFECTFGRGCEGLCCRNGRPSVTACEQQRIEQNLDRFMPELLPAARTVIEEQGCVSRRLKLGQPMLRVVDGWCVFFNQGCVLHKVGAMDGDKYRYKPRQCALFPLDQTEDGDWFIRQHGYLGEPWDLFCLAPDATTVSAVESLQEEISLAGRLSLTQPDAAAVPIGNSPVLPKTPETC